MLMGIQNNFSINGQCNKSSQKKKHLLNGVDLNSLMSMVQTSIIKIEWQALYFMHLINLKQKVKLDSSRAIVLTIKMVCN